MIGLTFAPGQYFKVSNEMELISKRYGYYGSYLHERWTVPEEGTHGYVQASSGQVLEITDKITPDFPGPWVVLKSKNISMTEEQTWFRDIAFDGWFMLINPKSGKALELPQDCYHSCQKIPAYINGINFHQYLNHFRT